MTRYKIKKNKCRLRLVLGYNSRMPASFHSIRHGLPTSGKALAMLDKSQARITHMSKTISITGGTKLSDLFTAYGKVVDKSKRKLVLSFDIYSDMKMVKGTVQANKEDKEYALSKLSIAEKAAILKYETYLKEATAARDTGALVERWTITGTATDGAIG